MIKRLLGLVLVVLSLSNCGVPVVETPRAVAANVSVTSNEEQTGNKVVPARVLNSGVAQDTAPERSDSENKIDSDPRKSM